MESSTKLQGSTSLAGRALIRATSTGSMANLLINLLIEGFTDWTISKLSVDAVITCNGVSAILFTASVPMVLILFYAIADLIWEKNKP